MYEIKSIDGKAFADALSEADTLVIDGITLNDIYIEQEEELRVEARYTEGGLEYRWEFDCEDIDKAVWCPDRKVWTVPCCMDGRGEKKLVSIALYRNESIMPHHSILEMARNLFGLRAPEAIEAFRGGVVDGMDPNLDSADRTRYENPDLQTAYEAGIHVGTALGMTQKPEEDDDDA